ncbi:MAG: carboxypeptidase M32 [Treponema sp.]|nr:carboxypeptidase M32 [Treponema sp.]
MRTELKKLIDLDRERVLVTHIASLLAWDQETHMPPGAEEERAEQLAWLEGAAHEKAVNPRIGEYLSALGCSDSNPRGDPGLGGDAGAFLRLLYRNYTREVKLPADLVTETAKAQSLGQAAWVRARSENDFAAFRPHLERILDLKRQAAVCLDPTKKPYDVLLDLFEPGSDEAQVRGVFEPLRKDLAALLAKIRSRPQVDDSFLRKPCSKEAQRTASRYFMELLGYDLRRGRLDVTAHPFTTTVGRADVRITTRYDEGYFLSSLFSTIHETGHALYEQGVNPPPEYAGTCLADGASMGIHESQSRMWENVVGRSRSFWSREYPALRAVLGEVLSGVSLDEFLRGINKVEPSLIRTEADEVTYGLHIILRFEMEADLLSGRLEVKDVPAAWNAKTKDLLGIEPPSDSKGCLQDVHWSAGLFGYFPSYSLGNLYAAQFVQALRRDLDLDSCLKAGDYASVLGWLRKKIHASGAALLPKELCEGVTGKPLDAGHFVDYLNRKYSEIYGF